MDHATYKELLSIAQSVIIDSFSLTYDPHSVNIEYMERIEKLLADYQATQRTFRGEEGIDFIECYDDFGTDEDSWQNKMQTTTVSEQTNPGHGRARRDSGKY